MDSNDGSVKEPQPKTLRFRDPDLLIKVGQDEKAYWCYPEVMAFHSGFIDTTLATPMRESETMKIEFPHLEVDVWESMMKFLDPEETCNMGFDDVMLIARACDKYDFARLSKDCDKVLSKCIYGKKIPTNVELLIDALLLANEANLQDSKKAAVAYLGDKLRSAGDFDDPIFTVDHIEKLLPVLEEDKVRDGLGLGEWTAEEVSNPLFPRCLIGDWARKREKALQAFIDTLDKIEILDRDTSRCILTKTSTFFANEREGFMVLQDAEGRWGIWARAYMERDYSLISTCSYGVGNPLPPTDGWGSTSFWTYDCTPTIKYMSGVRD